MADDLLGLLGQRVSEEPACPVYTFLQEGEGEHGSLTYSALVRRARTVAAGLREVCAVGDRVLLVFPPGLDFIPAFFGCLYSGVIAVPSDLPRPRRDALRLGAILRDSRPRVALTTSAARTGLLQYATRWPGLDMLSWIAVDELPECAAEDEERKPVGERPAFLQYTSGSTAFPKGVMVSQANILHNERMIQKAFAQGRDSVVVNWLPNHHDMGLIGGILQPLVCGGRCFLMSPAAFLQRPRRWLEAISRYRATTSGGPNFAYDLCVRRIPPEAREGLDLSNWRLAFNGAEPVRADTLERFTEAFAPCGFERRAFYPCYGLAEATLFVAGGRVDEPPRVELLDTAALERQDTALQRDGAAASRLVSCGVAWSGQRLAIADAETGTELPPGRIGEIWVARTSVACGYWRQPEETERTFLATLMSSRGDTEGPFLRTGDLGFLHEGELFVTGRLKDLIVIRGRNLYPQDLERTAEASHPAFRPGCGAAFSVADEDQERLVLVHEVERRLDAPLEEVIQAVRREIAEVHEVFAHEVVLIQAGSLPKTSSGKIQRHACRALYLRGELTVLARSEGRTQDAAEEEAALSAGGDAFLIEPSLRLAMARLLRVDPAGIDPHQPLTAYGLDSLSALELKAIIETRWGSAPPVSTLLDGISIRELIAWQPSGCAPDELAVSAGESSGEHPLSYSQRSLWFLDRLAPGSVAYVIAGAARLLGDCDPVALGRAFQALLDRHAALRTTFVDGPEGPRQKIQPRAEVAFLRLDASGRTEEEARSRLEQELFRPFDLERGPLLRAFLLERGSEGGSLLGLAVHHIAADLWSIAVLVRELGEIYDLLRAGGRAELPPPSASYLDSVHWQAHLLAGPEGERLWSYWQAQLAGAPPLDLPSDRPRPPVQTWRGASRPARLDREGAGNLHGLARSCGCTPFMTLLAGFAALLGCYSGQQDFLVGFPISGRAQDHLGARLENVVGYLVNPVALRADLAGDPTVEGWLRRVRRTALGAFEHQDLPFALLAERLRPDRDASRDALVQVMFALEKGPSGLAALAAFALGEAGARLAWRNLVLESVALENPSAQFDVELLAAELEGGFALSLRFNRDLFDAATADRMLGHYVALLAAAAASPRARVAELPLLAGPERSQLLMEWNDAAAAYPRETSVPELLRLQAGRTPDAPAVADESTGMTYRKLDRLVSQLARHLARLATMPEDVIGLLAERSSRFLVGMLGVFAARGAYLPLDPALPPQRLAELLRRSGCRLVLTTRENEPVLSRALAELPSEQRPRPLSLEELEESAAPDEESAGLPYPLDSAPRGLAYVLYTSGSTGEPKGAMIEHRGMLNHLYAKADALDLTAADVVAQTASPSFDISVWQFLVALLVGGRTEILGDATARDPVLLLDALDRQGVSIFETVPSMLGALLEEIESRPAASRPILASLRWLIATGEVLPPDLCDRWLRACPGIPLLNAYGPTECSDDVSHLTIHDSFPGSGSVPIGRPVINTRLHVVDRRLQLQPLGVPGELCVGGDGVGRGYLGDPGRTAEVFVPDPWGEQAGARLYRTGDLARHQPDGELEFLGRLDHQVKVRGFRIELGEVEAALARHPGVREAVVVAREEGAGTARLVAYVTAAAPELPPSARDLRSFLAEALPEYMLPAAFATLEALPLTPNGKVDRRRLPPVVAEPEARTGAAPSPTAELLAGIWGRVLGFSSVGPEDHFFELGGHSLLAVQVISRIRSTFGVDLPATALFRHPTLRRLAEEVDRVRSSQAGSGIAPLLPVRRTGPPPLSFAQERLWFLDRLHPGNPVYNVPVLLRLRGSFDAAVLSRALAAIVERHEVLRTTFMVVAEQPVQVIASPSPSSLSSLPCIDLAALPLSRSTEEARQLARGEAARPFDLERGPLLRAALIRLASAECFLVLNVHHIVADGWSMGILAEEISTLYSAFSSPLGAGAPLPPPLPVQYADFAVRQREWLSEGLLRQQISHWRGRLAGAAPIVDLPADRPRPAVQSLRGREEPFEISDELAAGLRALARREEVTLFMVLLAGLATLIHRHTGQEDLVLGSPVSHRNQIEVEGLIGLFLNMLPLRIEASPEHTFRELLVDVRRSALDAYVHQDVPFEHLIDELKLRRDLSRHPLFQVVLFFQQDPGLRLRLPGVETSLVPLHNGTAKFDLTLSLLESEEGLTGGIELDTDLFDATTVRRLGAHLANLLATAAAEPGQSLSELPLQSAAELAQILREWNDTAAAIPDACVHQLFALQAERMPQREAMVCAGERITYGELVTRARGLAAHLRSLGIGREVPVGIAMERTSEMVVALLGVLFAGGAYLPLDPAFPKERLALMVRDSGVPILLTQSRVAGALPEHGARTLILDPDWRGSEASAKDRLGAPMDPENLAYVLFTSGSTGRPKGVQVSHRALVNLLRAMQQSLELTAEDTFFAITSLSFDIAALELFLPLLVGARLELVPAEVARDGQRLLARFRGPGSKVLQATPSTWRMLLDLTKEAFGLRLALSGGEALHDDVAERLLPRVGRLYNVYGPTETTIWSTLFDVGRTGAGIVPIGRPIANTSIYLLGRQMDTVPVGAPGELYIGGLGVARGYLGRPDLTAERFVPDAFGATAGARLYRTGDLARLLPDGSLGFLGRADHQVKVRGFRIEPGEIESLLGSHPEVAQAVVMADGEGADRRLLAYVVPAGHQAPSPAELREFLRASLPEYMVPSVFLELAALPLTPNSKIDRRALPPPSGNWPEMEPGAAPQTACEELIATLWVELLRVDRVGRHDDFFDLGGQSLLAVQAVSRLRETFGVDLPLTALFQSPTVARLAMEVEQARSTGMRSQAPLVRTLRGAPLPLSFSQERLWFLQGLNQESGAFHLAGGIQLSGRLDLAALASSLREVCRRHEVLRTNFSEVDGRPMQHIRETVSSGLSLLDLSGLAPALRERECALDELANRPFDLMHERLLRTLVVRLAPSEHVLLLVLHHLVGDGWSMEVLAREVGEIYIAFAQGQPSPLAELPVQYADYSLWQRSWMRGDVLERHLAYWRERLSGPLPVLSFPMQRLRPTSPRFRGAAYPLHLTTGLSAAVQELSRRQGVTLFMTLLAAFEVLIHQYTGQDDLLVGTNMANRNRREIESLIGFFVNTLALRFDLSGDPTFCQLLRRVRRVTLEAFAHQDVPFEKVIEDLKPQRNGSFAPLFQVKLVLQNFPAAPRRLPDLRLTPLDLQARTANFDLVLVVEQGEEELTGSFVYDTDLFEASAIARMAGHFQTLLEAVVADPDRELSRFPIAMETEASELVSAFNQEI